MAMGQVGRIEERDRYIPGREAGASREFPLSNWGILQILHCSFTFDRVNCVAIPRLASLIRFERRD